MCCPDRRAAAAWLVAAMALGGCEGPAGSTVVRGAPGPSLAAAAAVQSGGPASAEAAGAAARLSAAAPTRVTFAYDDARLDAAALSTIEAQAAWLRAEPGTQVRLVGHADRPGGEPYNRALGLRRAQAVAAALIDRGVAPERIAAVDSLGESAPATPTPGRARENRRVDMRVVGAGGGAAPGFGMDGGRAQWAFGRYRVGEAVAPPVGMEASP